MRHTQHPENWQAQACSGFARNSDIAGVFVQNDGDAGVTMISNILTAQKIYLTAADAPSAHRCKRLAIATKFKNDCRTSQVRDVESKMRLASPSMRLSIVRFQRPPYHFFVPLDSHPPRRVHGVCSRISATIPTQEGASSSV
jgi:hypothetical protein